MGAEGGQARGAPERALQHVGAAQPGPGDGEAAHHVDQPLVAPGIDRHQRHVDPARLAPGTGLDREARGRQQGGGALHRLVRHRRRGTAGGRHLGTLGGDPVAGGLHVGRVGLVAQVVATRAHRGHRRRAHAHERVEHQVAPPGVELDEALRQLDREGGGMPHPGGALGRQLPHVQRGLHELVGRGGRLVRQPRGRPRGAVDGPVEPPLGRHHHPLGQVAQHRVGGAAERPPGAVAPRAPGLAPHHLAPQQQAQPVLEDADHVGRQRPVRLAPQVGDVDRDAAPRLQLGHALGEDVGQQVEVLVVRRGDALPPQLLLVLLAGEIGRRGDDQRHRVGLHPVHRAGVAQVDLVDHAGRPDVVVGGQHGRGEAPVERRSVVVLAPGHAEGGRRRRSPSPVACGHSQPSRCCHAGHTRDGV